MRCLYRDRWMSGEVNGDLVMVSSITMPTAPTSWRDVYIRFVSAASSATCTYTVHKTRDDARANETAIGSGSFSLGYSGSLAVVNAAPNPPDVTGMVLTIDTSDATDEQVLCIWGYTASPDLDLCEDYAELLAEYTGSGQSLERYAGAVQSYEPGKQVPKAFCYVQPDTIEAATQFDTRELRGRAFTMRFQVLLAGLAKGNQAGVLELLESQLRADIAAIESIVLDERRTLDGDRQRCANVTWAGVEMPAEAGGANKAWMTAALLVRVTILGFRSDYVEA